MTDMTQVYDPGAGTRDRAAMKGRFLNHAASGS
jgi:hypothetical protein